MHGHRGWPGALRDRAAMASCHWEWRGLATGRGGPLAGCAGGGAAGRGYDADPFWRAALGYSAYLSLGQRPAARTAWYSPPPRQHDDRLPAYPQGKTEVALAAALLASQDRGVSRFLVVPTVVLGWIWNAGSGTPVGPRRTAEPVRPVRLYRRPGRARTRRACVRRFETGGSVSW